MRRFAVVLGAVLLGSMVLDQASAAGICAMIFAPVCAVKNGTEKTYSNACMARNSHAITVYRGECRVR